MQARIIDEYDGDGNPIYETNADGTPKTDASGNAVIKKTEAYDRADVDAMLKEAAEAKEKLAKLEEANRLKDENFRKMRESKPADANPQLDVKKMVDEQLQTYQKETARTTARSTFSQRLGGDNAKVDAAMTYFDKLYAPNSSLDEIVSASLAIVSPQASKSNWSNSGASGGLNSTPAKQEFDPKSADRSFGYKAVSEALVQINNKENRLWNKPKV